MGTTANLLVLMFVLSFALYMGTPTHESTLFFGMFGNFTSTEFVAQMKAEFAILLGLSLLGGVVGGLYGGGSIMTGLLAGITTLLLGFFTMPVSLFMSSELPNDIRILLSGVFVIMYIMSLLSFFSRTEGA